jgi:hypothetical protein
LRHHNGVDHPKLRLLAHLLLDVILEDLLLDHQDVLLHEFSRLDDLEIDPSPLSDWGGVVGHSLRPTRPTVHVYADRFIYYNIHYDLKYI